MFFHPNRPLTPSEQSERNLVMIVYCLYTMVSITGFLGPLIGLFIAFHQNKKAQTELGKSHFKKQVRTAIYSLGIIILGLVLTFLALIVVHYADLSSSYDFTFFIGIGLSLLSAFWFLAISLMGFSKVLGGYNA